MSNKPNQQTTPFNKTGVEFFKRAVINDTMSRLDYGVELHDISIKVGRRFITVPMCPEAYENLCEFLNQALKDCYLLKEEEQC